ncbi:competence type IV pilus minor pilin ComGG [Streptococcaceae bacterium ESL0729]|nr:competence type IV pilus minor pilin ComGG [Streptococcaceae bacterium ESL0729]
MNRIKVRAGVLIQVLFLVAIFTAILEFYLFSMLSNRRNIVAQTNRIKAELMADLTFEKIKDEQKAGSIVFSDAFCFFEFVDGRYILKVVFSDNHGEVYQISRDKKSEDTGL